MKININIIIFYKPRMKKYSFITLVNNVNNIKKFFCAFKRANETYRVFLGNLMFKHCN